MPSQFNISLTSFTLKCSQKGIEPNFKVTFPDGKYYESKESVENNQGDYIWQDRATFAYLSERNHRLDKYFIRLTFHTKNKEFIGDLEIDLLSLVSGPMRLDLPLNHGINGCRILFICTSNEYIKSTLKIEQLIIDGLDNNNDYGVHARLLSRLDKVMDIKLKYDNDNNNYIQATDGILEDVLCYKDLQTDMELEIYTINDNNQYDIVRFGVYKLYVHEGLDYSFNTPSGRTVKLSLSLYDKPQFVQALNGVYYGFGRYSDYVPTQGACLINTSDPDIMKYNEPIAQPPEGAVKTFKPFTSKISFKSLVITGQNLPNSLIIRVRNTLNTKREKITLTRNDNGEYTCEDYHFIPFEVKRPYQLNRRFLILDLASENGDYLGDIFLNLHNLFCGPPNYVVDFKCQDEGMSATAKIALDVINGRTMKVKFTGFSLEANDQTRDCFIKFGFEGNELKFDLSREENDKLYFDGEYEVNIFYSTASKNIQAYLINVMVIEKRFLKELTKFTAKYSLMKILPFKTLKRLSIPFDQADMSNFNCDITMNTSLVKQGLYGEYQLLEGGVFDNGKMNASTFREVATFTEFSQPPYFPTYNEANEQPTIDTSSLDNVECNVLSGIENEDKVLLTLTETNIILTKLDDNSELLNAPLDTNLQSAYNNNQLTLITPNKHIQLYTRRAKDIKSYIDEHTSVAKPEEKKAPTVQGYYALCSTECRGAINMTCPVCNYHPMDFSLFKYGITHCDTCEFENYIHFKDGEQIDAKCPLCENQLRVLDDTLQDTFICSCGFPLGSQCKRCENIPEFGESPKVFIKQVCPECGQIQLINEQITDEVSCAKCKSPIVITY